jgi:hypothetical protein
MSNERTSDLTPFWPDATGSLEHLERDRWPEFERELRLRRPRLIRFDAHHYGAERQSWEWQVGRCRTWAEVERVLNRHRVAWKHKHGEIHMDGATIYRCR